MLPIYEALYFNRAPRVELSSPLNQIRGSMNQLWIYTNQFCSSAMPAELWSTILVMIYGYVQFISIIGLHKSICGVP